MLYCFLACSGKHPAADCPSVARSSVLFAASTCHGNVNKIANLFGMPVGSHDKASGHSQLCRKHLPGSSNGVHVWLCTGFLPRVSSIEPKEDLHWKLQVCIEDGWARSLRSLTGMGAKNQGRLHPTRQPGLTLRVQSTQYRVSRASLFGFVIMVLGIRYLTFGYLAPLGSSSSTGIMRSIRRAFVSLCLLITFCRNKAPNRLDR